MKIGRDFDSKVTWQYRKVTGQIVGPTGGAKPTMTICTDSKYSLLFFTCAGSYPTYLGCYVDKPSPRALPRSSVFSDTMTREYCFKHCVNNNHRYAAVQNMRDCYCGNTGDDYARYGEVGEGECNQACIGDPSQKCGGDVRQNVFDLGRCFPRRAQPFTVS